MKTLSLQPREVASAKLLLATIVKNSTKSKKLFASL